MSITYLGMLEEARDKIVRYFNNTSKIIINNNQDKHISVTIDNKVVTFYVKKKDMVELTGVIDIDDDYYGLGYKSVLEEDNVDYWIYEIRGEHYLIKTSELKKKVLGNEYDYKSDEPRKDGKSKEYYLVKEKKFISWCEKI